MSPSGDGCVVVAGIFPAGTVCSCVRVAGPEVMRAEGGTVVDMRTADDASLVGFNNLEVGGCYFVTGYVDGEPVELRVKGRTAAELNEFLSQPPMSATVIVQGTSETTAVAEWPAERPDLPSGVPADVAARVSGAQSASPVDEPAPELPHPAFYAYVGPAPEPSAATNWVVASKRVPEAGDLLPALRLWKWTGELPIPPEQAASWTVYEGPVEDVPAEGPAPAVSSSTDATASSGAVEDASGAASDNTPVQTPSASAPESPSPAASGDASGTDATPADKAPVGASTDAAPSAREQLLVQAPGLEVVNAASLSDDELRQAIIDKGATPAA